MEFFILCILICISIEDFNNQEFYEYWLGLLLISCLLCYLTSQMQCIFFVLGVIVLPLWLLNFKIEAIGSGDLWILLILSTCMSFKEFIVMFYVSTYVALIYGLIYKQQKIAFCPFITFGAFIAFIL